MRFRRTTLLMPLLSALWWGSCYAPQPPDQLTLPQAERDGRLALCGFAMACMALVLARQFGAFEDAGTGESPPR